MHFRSLFLKVGIGLAVGLSLVAVPVGYAAFQEVEEAVTATGDEAAKTSVSETTTSAVYPYQKTFIISAYYSPLVGQDRYVTGSYEGDIRLNGSGVNSADNTPVYPGMIAAPSTYRFGLKMDIPGLGVGAVHDRGGAIVKAGVRSNAYDRLDVWMGYGDVGLKRALTWGKRTITVTVYSADDPIEEKFYIEDFPINESLFLDSVVQLFQPDYFPDDLWYLTESEKVGELQYYLKKLGYYAEPITNFYGQKTLEAVYAFQIDHEIVESWNDLGAGHLGVRTRRTLETEIDRLKKEEDDEIEYNLGRDDEGDDVKKLQEALVALGYLEETDVSGEYDQKTIEAVFDFQQDNEIVSSEFESGAGFYGPKTHVVLQEKIAETKMEVSPRELVAELDNHPDLEEDLDYFTAGLQLGDKNAKVTKLQEELRKLGYFRMEPSGYFGEVTEHALFKLQQRFGLVADMESDGAGYLGPQTRERLNSIIGWRIETKRYLAAKREELKQRVYIAAETADLKKIEAAEDAVERIAADDENTEILVSSLTLGDRGEEVEILQKLLRNLGYYKGLTSQYFGEKTKKAVIAFQLDKNIIAVGDDPVAGLVGPQTRAALEEAPDQGGDNVTLAY